MCEGRIRVVIVKIVIRVAVVIRIGGNSLVLGWILRMEAHGLLHDGRGGVVGAGRLVKDIVVPSHHGPRGLAAFADSGRGHTVVAVTVVVVVGVRGSRVLLSACA